MERNGNKIKVRGLDILDDTPIIGIKPYWPIYEGLRIEKYQIGLVNSISECVAGMMVKQDGR